MSSERINTRESIRDFRLTEEQLADYNELIVQARESVFMELIQKAESGTPLTYAEAFAGALSIVTVNNPTLRNKIYPDKSYHELEMEAVVFLLTMRFQEERDLITPEEIAGMVAATRLDFTYIVNAPMIVETCGMGGDIGFGVSNFGEIYAALHDKIKIGFSSELEDSDLTAYYNFLMESVVLPDREIKQSYKTRNRKSANISTLASFVVASLGYPTMKHGSGKNTTAVGSTDAVRDFGFNVSFDSPSQPQNLLEQDGYVFTDAKLSKSIHDISGEVLRTETVNHLLGPLTPPISKDTRLNKLLGINHNIRFETISQAYQILHEKNVYNVGNVLIVGGYNELPDLSKKDIHTEICLDEFSPLGSIVGVVQNGKYKGKYVISDQDFGVSIKIESALLPSDETLINTANADIISNTANEDLINLVCCNTALAILTVDGSMDQDDFIIDETINPLYLHAAFIKARRAISEMRVKQLCDKMKSRVEALT